MSGRIVIAAYRAKPEKINDLLQILRAKRKFMLEAGYYSPRAPITMSSMKDPELVIEVFEWTSLEAISIAHEDSKVLEIWSKMDEICYEIGSRLNSFPEAMQSFPNFEPVDPYDD
ncbi:MAG: hypothetical protein IPG02_02710 [Ignavibacteria bacterium]|nr:hypothetical protein [Ignavibacteria bacterium]MBK9226130.1 hypothetical protein [Ignavibacteria bacterium]